MPNTYPFFPDAMPYPPAEPNCNPWIDCLPPTVPGSSETVTGFELNGNNLILSLSSGRTFTVVLPATGTGTGKHNLLQELYPPLPVTENHYHFSKDDYEKLQAIINPFKIPSLTLNSHSYQRKGTSYNAVIEGTITPQDAVVTSRRLLRNNALWQSPTTDTFSYQENNVTSLRAYRLRVQFSNYTTQEIERRVEFIAPYFTGAGAANLTATQIQTLPERLVPKGTITVTYSCNGERMYLSYPKSYGEIKKITNPSGFDITASFIRYEISVSYAGLPNETNYVLMSDTDFYNNGYAVTFSY